MNTQPYRSETYTVTFSATKKGGGRVKAFINGIVGFPSGDWATCRPPQRFRRPKEGETWEVEIFHDGQFDNGNPYYVLRPVRQLTSAEDLTPEMKAEAVQQANAARREAPFATNDMLDVITHPEAAFNNIYAIKWVAYVKSDPHDLKRTRQEMLDAIIVERPIGARSFSLISDQTFDYERSQSGSHVQVQVAYFREASTGDFRVPDEELAMYEEPLGEISEYVQLADGKLVSGEVFQMILDLLPRSGTLAYKRGVEFLNLRLEGVKNDPQPPVKTRFMATYPVYNRALRYCLLEGVELSVNLTRGLPRGLVTAAKGERLFEGTDLAPVIARLNQAFTCYHRLVFDKLPFSAFPLRDQDLLKKRGPKRGDRTARCELCGLVAMFEQPAYDPDYGDYGRGPSLY